MIMWKKGSREGIEELGRVRRFRGPENQNRRQLHRCPRGEVRRWGEGGKRKRRQMLRE